MKKQQHGWLLFLHILPDCNPNCKENTGKTLKCPFSYTRQGVEIPKFSTCRSLNLTCPYLTANYLLLFHLMYE